ncbi:acyltransferase family protein [Microbacterium nymphoidis]|uniref:acyltransferase family protein n=1 Tax=Microbacterium nymphoidis TaxID=2898586 RepID=UPI001E4605EC|nr:acyltransferase family protein [Microbacterium nymphoidis]MCD2499742.1 acyltransferase [Microbacterium nymphoidis]
MAAPRTRREARAHARRRFRLDIQALRAIAILAVVLNHLWPRAVTGGFIGVDVFFVISGFLITDHLFRELSSRGRIGLREFYARRIRRLLPAALLVLAVTLVGVVVLLPVTRWSVNALQIGASALYTQNWALAISSVDYFAHDAAPSAVQHYWSLSVEEQFYLIWPVLLLAAVMIRRRRRALRNRVVLALSVLGIVSFGLSVWLTALTPAAAYFSTFTRAWEFAAGGLVALLCQNRRIPRLLVFALVVGGLATVIACVFTLRGSSAFPGAIAAVPVLATAAVIIGGSGTARLPFWDQLAGLRPVQWLGEVSYSWYLWHWPVIVLLPFLIRAPLEDGHRVLIIAATLVLAWGTRRFVEVPAMRAPALALSAGRAFVASAIAVAVITAACFAIGIAARITADNAAAAPPAHVTGAGECTGPDALADPATCDVNAPVIDAESTAQDEYFATPPECGEAVDSLTYDDKLTTHRCIFGDAEPTARVWLVGDSHAQQWQGALFSLARERNWELTISFLGGCPVAEVAFTGFRDIWGDVDRDRCRTYSADVIAQIEQESPDLVFTSMAARQQLVDDGSGRDPAEQFTAGLAAAWQRWAAAGSLVIAIADTPLNGQVRPPDCVVLRASDPTACGVPRETALPGDPIVAAATVAGPGVHLMDLSDRMCDETTCFAAVGGMAVFYDADHLSLQYVLRLLPTFSDRLDAAIAAG